MRLRIELDRSVDRAIVLAAEYDAEQERGRGILADLNAWCDLAEGYVRAIAREKGSKP